MAQNQFQQFIKDNNINSVDIIPTPQSTRTATEAAAIHNVPVAAIVKSLLLKSPVKFYLFLVPGDKRIDFDRAALLVDDSPLRMATADEVKEVTGYSIGGVPPFGHKIKLKTVILDGFPDDTIIPAAGAHNAVFKTTKNTLCQILKETGIEYISENIDI